MLNGLPTSGGGKTRVSGRLEAEILYGGAKCLWVPSVETDVTLLVPTILRLTTRFLENLYPPVLHDIDHVE